MNQHPIEIWYHRIKTNDSSGLDDLLAEDVVFISPVVHTPQHGKALTKTYLSAAFHVFCNTTFRYIREIIGKFDAMLEFETVTDGVQVNGVDIITWNDQGKIIESKVMVRPLKAITVVHERMVALLATATGKA